MKTKLITLAAILFCFFAAAKTPAFTVTVTGKGQPLILIPGYSCSGEVWKETVDHLKNKFELHVLTLAGYAGNAPIETPILQTVQKELILYVKEKKLNKPMLIGHSLGAFMSLWAASEEPGLFGKIVCVDGLPFLAAMGKPHITADSLKNNPEFDVKKVIENFKALPDEGYVDNMTKAMRYQVESPERARQIAEWSYKSDRTTLGATIVELSLKDLRQDIAKITTPVLILASTYGTVEASEKIMNEQYKAVKHKTLKIADSKHFIMYDTPEWFYREIDAFLNN